MSVTWQHISLHRQYVCLFSNIATIHLTVRDAWHESCRMFAHSLRRILL